MSEPIPDRWAEWVLTTRYGTDEAHRRRVLDYLRPIRDRVLKNASISAGDTLIDVGTGDGLIAFGAVPLVGAEGKVILSDVSPTLIDHVAKSAAELQVYDRCDYLVASADDLNALGDGSVDVVTTRSVLIYLPAARKPDALREFHRVLRPGGRISLFEPINRFSNPEPPELLFGFDVRPIAAIAAKIRAAYEAHQPAATHPLCDFDERDLLDWVERAGFTEVHMSYEVEIAPGSVWPDEWDWFLDLSGNPLDPTPRDVIEEALTPQETNRLTAHLRPLVEAGRGVKRDAVVYLWATKPGLSAERPEI